MDVLSKCSIDLGFKHDPWSFTFSTFIDVDGKLALCKWMSFDSYGGERKMERNANIF